MKELHILLKDIAREWRGFPSSKYPGLIYSLRYKQRWPQHFGGGLSEEVAMALSLAIAELESAMSTIH